MTARRKRQRRIQKSWLGVFPKGVASQDDGLSRLPRKARRKPEPIAVILRQRAPSPPGLVSGEPQYLCRRHPQLGSDSGRSRQVRADKCRLLAVARFFTLLGAR